MSAGEVDPLLSKNEWHDGGGGTRGEGDGWVAHAVPADNTAPTLSRWLDGVESWLGRGLLVNWEGRFGGGRNTVRIVDRAPDAVRFERRFNDPVRVVLDGRYLLRFRGGVGIEVWRTDQWPRWLWATAAGIGVLSAMGLLQRLRCRMPGG